MGNPKMSAQDAEVHVLNYLASYECEGATEYTLSSAMGSVDDYVNGPRPLKGILEDLERQDDIERVAEFKFRVSRKGRERLGVSR